MSIKPAVKHELQVCQQQVSLLLDSQRAQRAMGMDSETLQPDALLAFFTERNLPFAYYVRSRSGIAIGETSAYEKNIATLNMYMAHPKSTPPPPGKPDGGGVLSDSLSQQHCRQNPAQRSWPGVWLQTVQ